MNARAKRGQKEEHLLNEKIRHSTVRVVSSGEGLDGVYSISDALKLAKKEGVDLIEINANAQPPICNIKDYPKFKYEQNKRDKQNKKNSKTVQLKELRFGPNTGDHDFNFKLKHAQEFLKKGHKVKAYVQFRGREMAFKDKGELILLRLAKEVGDLGKIDELPKMNGKKMLMTISPRVKK